MKRTLLSLSLLSLIMLFGMTASAQCTPDPTVPSGSFAPNPLPCGEVGVPYSEVVSFAFPPDTAYDAGPLGTLTLPFDSFALSSIANIPPGLAYTCDAGAGCVYVTSPPNITRGCVTIAGTPTTVQASTDSVVVTGTAYITVFGSAVDLDIDINISVEVVPSGDTCSTSVGRSSDLENVFDLQVYPNPLTSTSRVSFDMPKSGNVSLEVYNSMGQHAGELYRGHLGAGKQSVELGMNDLPKGIYFVKFSLNNGEFSTMKKVLSVK